VKDGGRLLDLACGTGEVALALQPLFAEVWAVDQEPDMIAVGQRKAEQAGVRNVRWITQRAEDVEAPSGFFELITIGSAFHRLDRRLIAERALDWLPPNRCLSVLGSNSLWTGKEEWQGIARNVIDEWSGGRLRTTTKAPESPHASHIDVLAAAGFVDIEQRDFPTHYVWTPDTITGYLRSTALLSTLASDRSPEQLEAELRPALLDYDPSGQYEETMAFYYVLARRPGPTVRRCRLEGLALRARDTLRRLSEHFSNPAAHPTARQGAPGVLRC
jgi:SAM-dependent methyltransferase